MGSGRRGGSDLTGWSRKGILCGLSGDALPLDLSSSSMVGDSCLVAVPALC